MLFSSSLLGADKASLHDTQHFSPSIFIFISDKISVRTRKFLIRVSAHRDKICYTILILESSNHSLQLTSPSLRLEMQLISNVRPQKGIMKKIELGAWIQIGILIVMAVGLGFTMGYNLRSEKIKVLETQLATFDFAKKANLKNLLLSLQMASEQLKDSLLLTEENQKLKRELTTVNSQNAKLISEQNDLKSKFEYLKNLVNTKYGDTDRFKLKYGVTKYLFGNKIILAWERPLSVSGIYLKLNNVTKNLDVGEFVEFKVDGDTYKLVFDSFSDNYNEAIFIYSK